MMADNAVFVRAAKTASKIDNLMDEIHPQNFVIFHDKQIQEGSVYHTPSLTVN